MYFSVAGSASTGMMTKPEIERSAQPPESEEGMTVPEDVDFELLLDWLEGRLSEEEARKVEEMAIVDESVRAEAEWLRAFVRVSDETTLEKPPPEVRQNLSRRFAAYAGQKSRAGFLQRILATLTFDSNAQPAMAGFRSAGGSGASRQLVYDAEVAEIALNVRGRPNNGHVDVYGQVFPDVDENPDAFSVQLLKGADEVGLTSADELGEFIFEGVEPGTYEMILSAAQIEFLVSPVEIYP